ncbi:MAG TPA: metallophosphoesterase [Acidimicrobiia bacterium]|nr:metallophosphoesterase [Acidimicrobiia bacterium]
MRIAAVADVHVGIDSADLLRPGLAHVSADADVLLIAGDLTQVGAPEEAKVLAGELEGVEIPVLAVLGNHDHHSDAPHVVREVLESVGVVVLDGDTVTLDVGGQRLGVVGDTGFGGGFAGASGSAFGEPEMKHFMRRTERSAERIDHGLRALDADVRVVLLHYSPVKDTVVGERAEIFPFLGSYLLAHAVDDVGADLVVHGHAHAGSEQGVTPGGVRVRNVALPLIRRPYRVFHLDE